MAVDSGELSQTSRSPPSRGEGGGKCSAGCTSLSHSRVCHGQLLSLQRIKPWESWFWIFGFFEPSRGLNTSVFSWTVILSGMSM